MSSEKKEKDKKRLKKIAKAVIIAFGILAVIYAASLVVTHFMKSDKIATRVVDKSIAFSDADYAFNIFDDPIYASKSRNISKNEYGEVYTIGDDYDGDNDWHGMAPREVYERDGREAAFWRDYFVCVITGDHKSYPTFFTDNFFNYYTIPEKFTMQKIYGISIEVFNREPAVVDGKNAVVAEFIVRYKIMNNNGTFRGDVPSDTVKPLYFKLVETDDKIGIDSISFVQNKKAENDK